MLKPPRAGSYVERVLGTRRAAAAAQASMQPPPPCEVGATPAARRGAAGARVTAQLRLRKAIHRESGAKCCGKLALRLTPPFQRL